MWPPTCKHNVSWLHHWVVICLCHMSNDVTRTNNNSTTTSTTTTTQRRVNNTVTVIREEGSPTKSEERSSGMFFFIKYIYILINSIKIASTRTSMSTSIELWLTSHHHLTTSQHPHPRFKSESVGLFFYPAPQSCHTPHPRFKHELVGFFHPATLLKLCRSHDLWSYETAVLVSGWKQQIKRCKRELVAALQEM